MLEVLPHHMHGRFESYRLVTRSEAAFMLDESDPNSRELLAKWQALTVKKAGS